MNRDNITNAMEIAKLGEITAKDGLLWHRGEIIPVHIADIIAAFNGFYCAEQLVRKLEKEKEQ